MKYKKVLAIISFTLMMAALAFAFISDFVIFKDAIFGFIVSIFASVLVFLFMIILMILSIMLIFGVILLEQNGFWPLDFAKNTFHEMINDITITTSQISTFQALRVVILVICIATFVMSIIAMHKGEDKKVPLKGMSVVTLIFSIFGILTAIGLLAITNLVL